MPYFDKLMLTQKPLPSSLSKGIFEKTKTLGSRALLRVKIWGNLGDQLFQYALAIHLTEINQASVEFNDEEFWHFHYYQSIAQELRNRVGTAFQFKRSNPSGALALVRGFYLKLFYRTQLFDDSLDQVQKRKFTTIENYVGHFRNERFFKGSEAQVFQAFDFSESVAAAGLSALRIEIEKSNSVGIHLMNADYLKLKEGKLAWTGVNSHEFYQKEIAQIQKTNLDTKLFVFTDDEPWCIKYFPEIARAHFVQGFNENKIEYLSLLSSCKHQVLSATSFGWWAGWLGQRAK